jgi:hypothetical protein
MYLTYIRMYKDHRHHLLHHFPQILILTFISEDLISGCFRSQMCKGTATLFGAISWNFDIMMASFSVLTTS